jgi:hypothetical protein
MRGGGMRVGGMRVGGMRVRGMRVRGMPVKEEASPVLSWDVLVSSPLNGCRGYVLADAWVAD